jgi:hypothetical protein
MTDVVPQPCARWADLLAAHPDSLSAAERRALDGHVASCQACAAVRLDYQRMETRIRSLPDPRTRPGFPPWLLALQEAARHDAPAPSHIIPFHSMEQHMQTKKEAGAEVPAPTPINQGQHARRRVVSWASAVAALAVIALITAALLASHSGGPAKTAGPKNTTPTLAPSQGWAVVAGLDHLSAQPLIAPSNPQIIYLVGINPLTLKRSDDGGGHWTALPLPSGASQAYAAPLIINAGNANNILLLLSFDTPSLCSANQASTGQFHGYSGYSCQIPYYSIDGGADWSQMRSSVTGQLTQIETIFTQGGNFYVEYYDENQHHRLSVSANGLHWGSADEALISQGLGICALAATPRGSSVYALVQSGYCSQPVGYLRGSAMHSQAQSGLAIWRTDDAGAHWTKVSAFPYQQPDTANFWAVDTGAQPTLLAAAGQGTTYQRLFSTDGGKTWQPLPTEGLPASAVFPSLTQAALSDGSLLMQIQTKLGGPTTFYALKPGSQTWRQITTPLTDKPTQVVVSSAGGYDILWVVTTYAGDFTNGDFSVYVYNLN